jgi:regulator of sigma E protease
MQTLIAFMVVLGVLVTIHELGHYWMARYFNILVLRFSIGFGKPFYTRISGADRTEWALAPIPLGGYVKLLDERGMTDAEKAQFSPEQWQRSFNHQVLWKRMLVIAAGPLINAVAALVIFWGVLLIPQPQPAPLLAPSTITHQSAFKVTAVNDTPITSWVDLQREIHQQWQTDTAQPLNIKLTGYAVDPLRWQDNAYGLPTHVTLKGQAADEAALIALWQNQWQLRPYVKSTAIAAVTANQPADKAGLRAGDVIQRVNDVAVQSPYDIQTALQTLQRQNQGDFAITVLRDQKIVLIQSVQLPNTAKIGVQLQPDLYQVTQRYDVFAALQQAAQQCWTITTGSLSMLAKMLTGQASLNNLSGPLSIADGAGKMAQRGWSAYLTFMGLISMSLAVLNLLPIPVLDGGYLVLGMIEALRGKALSPTTQARLQQIGMLCVMLLSVVALGNDVLKYFFN